MKPNIYSEITYLSTDDLWARLFRLGRGDAGEGHLPFPACGDNRSRSASLVEIHGILECLENLSSEPFLGPFLHVYENPRHDVSLPLRSYRKLQ